MAAGFRSPHPLFGLGAGPAPTTTGGVRSLLAPWIGGAGSASVTPTNDAGARSLLAFWVGGAGALGVTPIVTGGGGGGPIDEVYSWRGEKRPEPELYDERAALRETLQRAVDALDGPRDSAQGTTGADSIAARAEPSGALAEALRPALARQMPAAAADVQGANSLLFAAALALLEDDD